MARVVQQLEPQVDLSNQEQVVPKSLRCVCQSLKMARQEMRSYDWVSLSSITLPCLLKHAHLVALGPVTGRPASDLTKVEPQILRKGL